MMVICQFTTIDFSVLSCLILLVSDTAITTIKDVSAMASSQRSAQLKIIQSHIDLSLETNINNLNNNTPLIHGNYQ